MITFKKTTSLFLLLMLIGSPAAFAQTEQAVSEEEMKQFAASIQQVEIINQQAQQKMVSAVEKEGIEVERYNEMQQADMDPDREIDATGEEMEKYNQATEALAIIQARTQEEMQDKITQEGLTVARYQEIATIISNDPEMQQKLREILQDQVEPQ
ncbi:MAG: DUF4168 domain-containing protein [Bacteroidales bacterium]